MEEEKSTIFRVLTLLTTKKVDEQRCDHLNIIKCFLLKNLHMKDIISKINKSLSVASTRDRGFELLSDLLEFLPIEIVNENAVSWITVALGPHQKSTVKPLRLSIIGRLIDLCSNTPEFKKVVVADYLAEIIQACLKGDACNLPQHSLTCLTTCLIRFSSSCLPYKNNIEATLTKCLQYEGDDLIFLKKAAVAYHYINQIGGGGTDGINHQNNWTKQFRSLCSSTHELLSEFNLDSTDCIKSVVKKLRNSVIFLKTMLEKSYPVPKIVPLQTILDVISTALDNHECISGNLLEKAEICSVIARLQVDFLYLLRSLIACTQQRLIPFSLIINKMLLNYLRRIHSCDCFKNNKLYSVAIHTVIRFWMTTARNSFHCSFHEKLIRFILDDISPVEQKLILQLDQNKNTKKKKALNDTKSVPVYLDSKDPCALKNNREEVCLQSLETLEVFLQCIYLKIDSKLVKELYTTLTKTLMNIQGGKIVAPYTNLKCQLLLYRAIISLFEQPFLPVPAPLSLAIHLLNVGQRNSNTAIATACENGLNKLELLCQPVCSTMYIGKEKSVENDSHDDVMQLERKEKIRIISDIVIKPLENAEEEVEELIDSEVASNDIVIKPSEINEEEIEDCIESEVVISDIVIKQTENANEPEDSIESEVIITEVQEVEKNKQEAKSNCLNEDLQKSADDNADICIYVEDSAEETTEQNEEIKVHSNPQVNGNKDVIEILDEPPAKRNKIDFEENSNESMLDSFVNVVNDY